MSASTPTSVRLDDVTRARLAAAAERFDRPAAQIATRAIRSWLDAQDELHRQIDAAVEDADRGVFLSSEAVGAWMEGWGTDRDGPVPQPDIRPAGDAAP